MRWRSDHLWYCVCLSTSVCDKALQLAALKQV